MFRFLLIAVAFFVLESTVTPDVAAQQPSPGATRLTLEQQLAQTEARRRNRIAGNMLLSGEEARSFWSVYDEYRGTVVQVRKRQLDVIVEYADAYNRGGLAPDKAQALLDEAMQLESERYRLKREYLRKAGSASAGEKADAEKHIADCEALIAKKEPEVVQPTLPNPEPRRPEARIEPEPPPPIPPEPKAKEPIPGVREHAISTAGEGAGLRVAGIVTLSVGAAALIGGLVTNLQYNTKVGDMQKSYDPKVDDSAQTYHTLSVAGYGVGAACMVGGAILYYLGWQEGRAALVPVTVAGGGGAALTGAF